MFDVMREVVPDAEVQVKERAKATKCEVEMASYVN